MHLARMHSAIAVTELRSVSVPTSMRPFAVPVLAAPDILMTWHQLASRFRACLRPNAHSLPSPIAASNHAALLAAAAAANRVSGMLHACCARCTCRPTRDFSAARCGRCCERWDGGAGRRVGLQAPDAQVEQRGEGGPGAVEQHEVARQRPHLPGAHALCQGAFEVKDRECI